MPRVIIHFHLSITVVTGQSFSISQKSFLALFAKRHRISIAVSFRFLFVLLSSNPFRLLKGSKTQICQSCGVSWYGIKFTCCFRLPHSRTFMQLFSLIIELCFQPSSYCRKYQIRISLKRGKTHWFVKEGSAIMFLCTSLAFNFKSFTWKHSILQSRVSRQYSETQATVFISKYPSEGVVWYIELQISDDIELGGLVQENKLKNLRWL